MSKVNIYGLKAYISKTFDLHVGKRIKYVECGGEEKEHIYGGKTAFSALRFTGRYFRSYKNLPLLQQIKLDVKRD